MVAGGRASWSSGARQNGLDFMGTSEHNTNAATRVFGHVVPDGFLVVSGEEVTNTQRPLARHRHHTRDLGRLAVPAGGTTGSADFTQLTRARGGVAIAAHPYVPVAGTRWDFRQVLRAHGRRRGVERALVAPSTS
jgi:hypothetical protein